jgi:hypothetical protein
MRAVRNSFRILARKLGGRDHFEDLGLVGRIAFRESVKK